MFVESKITDGINNLLSKIQNALSRVVEGSYILSNIDNILFGFICLSLIVSILMSNSYCAPLLCIVAVLYFLLMMLKKGTQLKLERSTLFLWLYFVMAIVSTINSTMFHASCFGLSKTIMYLLYFYAILQYLRDNRDKIGILVGLITVCVSFEVVIAYIQNNFDVLSAATWQDTRYVNPEHVLTRVYGTLQPSNPNLLGGYLIAASSFVWLFTALAWIDGKKNQFLIGAIFSLALVPAIFMTGCRGAYIALFFMFLFLAYFVYQILKTNYPAVYEIVNKHKNAIIAWVFGLGAAIIVCVPKISHRILSIFAMRNDSSTSFRMNVYHSSWQMFQDNVLFGIGCGNKVFREIYGLYMLSGFDALSAYSIYLETAVESGIFALIFYLLFIGFLIYDGFKMFVKTNDLKTKVFLAAGLTGVAGVLIHGFVDTVYFRPQIQLIFWILVAMISVYSHENELFENSVKND